MLKRIGKASKAYHIDYGKFPVGISDLQPPTECCAYPDRMCPQDYTAWSGPLTELVVEPETAHRFRASYRSTDGQSYVARLVGDEDCDGKKTMYELWGYTVDGLPAYQIKNPF